MVTLRRLPAEAAKMRKNAARLYRRLKLAEYGWLALLSRHAKGDVLSLSKNVLKDAGLDPNVSYTHNLGPALMAIALIKGKKSIFAMNMALRDGYTKLLGIEGINNSIKHELVHAFQAKRNIPFDVGIPIGVRDQMYRLISYHEGNTKNKKIQKIISKVAQGKPTTIEEKKLLDANYREAFELGKEEELELLRSLDSHTLKKIKLNGIIEFQAIDKSIRYDLRQGTKLSDDYLRATTNYRLLFEKLNSWVRMVEKERRLAAITKQ